MFKSPHRVAWATVLSSSVIFCLFCAGGVWAVQWALFEMPMDVDMMVYVSRGTIGVASADEANEIVVRDRYEIEPGDRLTTDSVSQANLTFRDPHNQDTIVASVQLLAGSQLELAEGTRPRFGLGDAPFALRFEAVKGHIELLVAPDLDRDVKIDVISDAGRVIIRESGYFVMQMSEGIINLDVIEGRAEIANLDGERLPVGWAETGSVNIDQTLHREHVLVNLLPNGHFVEGGAADDVAAGWGCYTEADALADKRGEHERTRFQERNVIHFERIDRDRTLGHGETGCEQRDLGIRIDENEYDRLTIRVSMYLVEQSLSGCGELGTECALMLRMVYLDDEGAQEWIQGFYIFYTEGIGQINCGGCPRPHEQVNGEAWFTYVEDLPVDDVSEIQYVRFYSSGHQYEVYVSEFSIVGQKRPGI
jgi:hypothetical protein